MARNRNSKGNILSITGLSADAQDAIAKAARMQRRSVNAWATSALKNAAQATLDDSSVDNVNDEVLALLKRISRKLDQMAARSSPAEKARDQVQTRLHDVGDQLGSVLDEVRERGSETIDEVREQSSEISEKAAKTFSQWRKAADKTIQELQQNLGDLQKSVVDAAGLTRTQKDIATAENKTSVKRPAGSQSAPKKKVPKTRKKAKQPVTKKSPAPRAGK